VVVDRSRLAGYARVCGFRLTDALPATYPHVLAFPLALQLMTAPEFPFPAAGVVHLANRIELHRSLDAGEPLDLAVHAERLRPHPRGQQVDLVTVASVAGAEAWREVSTYLHRTASASASGSGSASGSHSGERPPAPAPAAVWRVAADTGRAYAAVSGDWNPIHSSTLAARAFGFRRRIAHGMWTKARCLAQLAPRLPAAYAVAVTFQAPILLPATVGFSIDGSGAGFAVHDRRSGRPHLSGTVEPAPAVGT
jgi:acyl dehydratase